MLIRFPTPKGLKYTIDLANIAHRTAPRTVEAPIEGWIAEPTVIDWGDGTTETVQPGSAAFPTHTYAEGQDVFTIVIRSATGHLPKIRFAANSYDSDQPEKFAITKAVTAISHFAGEQGTSTVLVVHMLCKGASSLTYVDPRYAGYYKYSALMQVFSGCSSLAQDIKTFNFSFADQAEELAFNATFFNCTGLTGSIPEGLFANNTLAKSFSMVFRGCTGLTGSIPEGLFANNTLATTFYYAFQGCTGLTGSIPEGLFANNTLINGNGLGYVFSGCTGLTGSIPEGLFDSNTLATVMEGMFNNCSGLTGSIPEGLFANNTLAKSFSTVFCGCSGLTGSIPEGLFANNTFLESVASTFYNCSGLTGSIPEGLFDNCHSLKTVSSCFRSLDKLTGAPYVFWDAIKHPDITDSADCYTACSAEMRAQVPVAYGGTMTD